MMVDAKSVPIFVMSYNDLVSLRLCLRALSRRTVYPHALTVIDNASTDPGLIRFLEKLSGLTKIRVYRNKVNLWVLGLNKAVGEWARQSVEDDFYVLTDCDILPPPPLLGKCWLTRMLAMMTQNACVGKLGISLDLGYIKNRKQFEHTYNREMFFMDGPRIGDLVIAPVDTTLALYRKSLFVSDRPLFIPGHQSLYRPYYYCCRTPATFRAKHLSWRFYGSRSESDIVAKMFCFGLVGATVVPALYNAAPLTARWFYVLVRPLARVFWGVLTVILQVSYFIKSLPRMYNRIQDSRRA